MSNQKQATFNRMIDRQYEAIFRDWYPAVKEHLQRVDISPVVKWFYEVNDREHYYPPEDFPVVVPPWELCWMEGASPKFINSEGEIVELGFNKTIQRLATLQLTLPYDWSARMVDRGLDPWTVAPEDYPDDLVRQLVVFKAATGFRGLGKTMAARLQRIWTEHPGKWTMITALFVEEASGRCALLETFFDILDDEGGFIDGTRASMHHAVKPHSLRSFSGLLYPFMFATNLLHCKNVDVEDAPLPPSGLQKKRTKKGLPPYHEDFKMLDIFPSQRGSSGKGSGEIKKALHMCRGHFRTYTEDAPLFGKHVGRYWVPQHVRGSADVGRVDKDYRVHRDRQDA